VSTAQIRPDAVLLLGVGGAQPCEPHQLRIYLSFLDHQWIAGSDGFHLGVGKCRRFQVFHTANGHVAAHHLGDELGFGLQRLPHVGVERAFGDVAKNRDDRVLVALPQNPPLTLLYVGGSPGRVKVMQSDQTLLHVRP